MTRTLTCCWLRCTASVIVSPGLCPLMASARADSPWSDCPSMAVMMSSGWRPGSSCRRARNHLADDGPVLDLDTKPRGERRIQRHILDPDERMDDLTVLDELVGDRLGRRDRNGETNALGLHSWFGLASHERSNPDHSPLHVDDGPPELPGLMGASVCTTSNRNGPADWLAALGVERPPPG